MPRADIQLEMGFNSSRVKRGLKKTEGRIKRFSKSAVASVGRVASAFAGVFLVKSIIGLGTAAAETASKFRAVFGPAADEMNKKVAELQRTIPGTKQEMQGALATFAQMAKAFGLNEKAANMFSVEMVKIAGDLASFNNLGIEETFTKIRSAISGEFEPMKQLGIVINQARLEQEGLNMAIWDGTGQMSAAQKALAVQSIIIRDMGDANGDAAATAESAANQIKFMRAQLTDMGADIGVTVLPAIIKLVEWTGKAAKGIKGAAEAVGEFIGRAAFMGGMSDDQFEAKLQLESEGAFEGKSNRGDVRKKMIDARVKLIQEQRAAEEKAAEEKRKADETAIKNATDLNGELKAQIKAETDPIRKKALEDRLEAYKQLIAAAGQLESQQTGKPGSRAGSGGSRSGGSAGSGSQSHRQRLLADEMERNRALQKMEAERAANKTGLDNVPHIKSYRIGSHRIGADDKGKPGTGPKSEATLLAEAEKTVNHLEGIYNILSSEED